MLFLLIAALGQITNLKVYIHQSAFDKITSKLIPQVIQLIQDDTVMQQGFSPTNGLLSFDFFLWDMIFTNTTNVQDTSYIKLNQPSSIDSQLRGFSGNLHSKWFYSNKMGEEQGSFDLQYKNLEFLTEITLGEQEGRLTVELNTVYLRFDQFDITVSDNPIAIHGNWYLQNYKDTLIDSLRLAVQQIVRLGIEQELANYLDDLDMQFKIGNDITIDMALSKSPQVVNESLNFYLKGAVYQGDDTDADYPIEYFDGFDLKDYGEEEIKISLNEYFFNSVLYVAHLTGELSIAITPEMIPQNDFITLNTMYLEILIPGLFSQYGLKPVDIGIKSASNPTVAFKQADAYHQNGFFQIQGQFSIQFNVRDEGTAVEINVALVIEGEVVIKDWKLREQIDEIRIDSIQQTVNNMNRDLNVEQLKTSINILLQQVVELIQNYLDQQTLDLPEIPYLDMSQSRVSIQNRFILIENTPIYKF